MSHNLMNTLKEFKLASGKTGKYYSLPALEKALGNKISRLPVSVRIVLESVLRNCDGKKVAEVLTGLTIDSPFGANGKLTMRAEDHTVVDYALGWGTLEP